MRHLRVLFASSFFFSAHFAVLAYINSSSLSRFVPEKLTGMIYVASSLMALYLLIRAPRLLRAFGNWKVTTSVLGISIVLLAILGSVPSGFVVIPVFIIYYALNILTLYLLDIFIEHYSSTESTGRTRGLYLSLNGIAWVIAPILVSRLITSEGFSAAYLLAAALMIPSLVLIATRQRNFKDKEYRVIRFSESLQDLKLRRDIKTSTILNFLLHFFYAWMVVYTPLYLLSSHQFNWEQIGILFTVMLLPFVLFQYPAGRIADGLLGEKELLIAGFVIMAGATLALALTESGGMFIVGLILFMSRVGASLVESMNESYFFKQITESETHFLSFFRDMLPLAYIIAPLIGTLILSGASYKTLFTVLSIFMITGALFALRLKDTR